jgi:sugar phosphate isomerase/epimerase
MKPHMKSRDWSGLEARRHSAVPGGSLTRRAALALPAAALAAQAASHSIRLGGPVFLKSQDPAELAREHRRLGYTAAYCPNIRIEDAARTEQAYAREKVVIAEVGAWRNMLDPDAAKRKENLAYVTQRLALAEAVGAMCCVDIAGSYNPTVWYGPHPKNFSKEFFEATVENCRTLIDAVKPKRTFFTVEMMGWALPTGPDEYLALLKAVDRPAFAVHFDPCNGINSPARFYRNAEFISECVTKLGRWIRSCHAKDLEWKPEMNVHFVEVIPGRGAVDYNTYLRVLGTLPQRPPLMLEHLKTAEEYKEGADYIRKTGGPAIA